MSAMRELILVLHIFLAIIWAGGIMFIGWGVFPASLKLPLAKQRYFLISLMKSTHHLFSLAGFFVIITGILLGTVFGPIRTWDYLWSTTYRSEEHTSELQSRGHLVCRLLLEKNN